MELFTLPIPEKETFYDLASEYLNNINLQEYENIKVDNILPKSISILIDHEFIPAPCIKIKMNLFQDQNEIGAYYLYVTKDKEFVDEFLIIK